MSAVFELGLEFLRSEDLALSLPDLRYGLTRGYLKPHVAIELALDEVRRGSQDPLLNEVAGLFSDEADRVSDVLETSVSVPGEDESASRKWLYLQLKAAYIERSALRDPLAVAEELYSDFDYPGEVGRFIRYMPLQPGDEPGDAALLRRWSDFLEREHAALARSTPRSS